MTDYRQKEVEVETQKDGWVPGTPTNVLSGRAWVEAPTEKVISHEPFEGIIYKSKAVQFWDLTDPTTAGRKNVEPGYYITLFPVSKEELNNPSLLLPYKQEFMQKVAQHPEFRDFTPQFRFHFIGYTKSSKAMVWEAVPQTY